MAFVVTENCVRCKYTDCVEVCPVDCFHVGPDMLVIDPDECIDCALCESTCPANAIFSEDEVPAAQQGFVEYNARKSKEWPVMTQHIDNPQAKEWDGVAGKREFLDDFGA